MKKAYIRPFLYCLGEGLEGWAKQVCLIVNDAESNGYKRGKEDAKHHPS